MPGSPSLVGRAPGNLTAAQRVLARDREFESPSRRHHSSAARRGRAPAAAAAKALSPIPIRARGAPAAGPARRTAHNR